MAVQARKQIVSTSKKKAIEIAREDRNTFSNASKFRAEELKFDGFDISITPSKE
jgi:hypothetical protein